MKFIKITAYAPVQALLTSMSLLAFVSADVLAQTTATPAPEASTATSPVEHGHWTLAAVNCDSHGNFAGSAALFFGQAEADPRPSYVHFFDNLLVEEFGQSPGCVISRQSRILNITATSMTVEPQVLKMSEACKFVLPARPSLTVFEPGLRIERAVETRTENGNTTARRITSYNPWDFEQMGCRAVTPSTEDSEPILDESEQPDESVTTVPPATPPATNAPVPPHATEVLFQLIPMRRVERSSVLVRQLLTRDAEFLAAASEGDLPRLQTIVQGSMITSAPDSTRPSFSLPSINTEARDQDGRTALMLAAMNGHHEVVSYLISIRASARAMDRNGNTALSLARAANHTRVVEILEPKVTTFEVVAANPQWQDSVTIASNQTVSVEVSGSWGVIDPTSRGNRGFNGYEIDGGPGFFVPGHREGELLMRVFGTGQQIRLGGPAHTLPVIAGPGVLQFMANDGSQSSTMLMHEGSAYRDNIGALSVRITTELM